MRDDKDILVHASVVSVEWRCSLCGDGGAGFMPEPHASGACEATRTVPRMDPDVAREAQRMVRTMLDGTLYADGGGI